MTVLDDATCTMHVMDGTGDTKHIWDPNKPEEVAAAQKVFDELVGKKKYLAYTVKTDGEKGEVIRRFDKTAGRIILAPQPVGG